MDLLRSNCKPLLLQYKHCVNCACFYCKHSTVCTLNYHKYFTERYISNLSESSQQQSQASVAWILPSELCKQLQIHLCAIYKNSIRTHTKYYKQNEKSAQYYIINEHILIFQLYWFAPYQSHLPWPMHLILSKI